MWDDLSTLYMAAQMLGYDKPEPSHLYNLSDDELAAVKQKLLALKPNIRKIWSTGGELTNLFRKSRNRGGNGLAADDQSIAASQFPNRRNHPEGKHYRVDRSPDDHQSQPDKDLAYAFLEYMIQAQTQKRITDVTHYTPANPAAANS